MTKEISMKRKLFGMAGMLAVMPALGLFVGCVTAKTYDGASLVGGPTNQGEMVIALSTPNFGHNTILAVNDKAVPPAQGGIPVLLTALWSPLTLPAGRAYTLRIRWSLPIGKQALSGTKDIKVPVLKAGVYKVVAFQMGSPFAAQLGWGDFKEPTGRSNAVLLALVDEDYVMLALAM
jgi:hypothetical protein